VLRRTGAEVPLAELMGVSLTGAGLSPSITHLDGRFELQHIREGELVLELALNGYAGTRQTLFVSEGQMLELGDLPLQSELR
jgi:hypothetical protein